MIHFMKFRIRNAKMGIQSVKKFFRRSRMFKNEFAVFEYFIPGNRAAGDVI